MSGKKTDMHRVIAAAIELFRTQGYCNTSVKNIADACNLSKASVYHYVPSKQALAIAALQQVQHDCQEQIFSLVYQDDWSVRERLNLFTRALIKYFQEQKGNCLMNRLAHEVIDVIPEFVRPIQTFFKSWEAAVAHLLMEHYKEEDAVLLAQDVVCQMHGAVMMFRVDQDSNCLERVEDKMYKLLEGV